jgi:hypothetical protein
VVRLVRRPDRATRRPSRAPGRFSKASSAAAVVGSFAIYAAPDSYKLVILAFAEGFVCAMVYHGLRSGEVAARARGYDGKWPL